MRWMRLALESLAVLVLALPVPAADSPGGDAGDRREIAREVLDRLIDLGDEDLRRPGGDPSDFVAKAADLGGDPERILSFVGREVAFEPYAGLLRGPRGTLACRSGNSLDRSLLLREMLAASGRRSRLVKGALSPEKAKALVEMYLARDPLAGPLGEYRSPGREADTAAYCRGFAEAAGLSLEFVRDLFARQERESRRLEEGIRDAARRELAHLREVQGLGNLVKARTSARWIQELEARVADHYWVQVPAEGGEESWKDLDPSLPGLEPGKSAAEASEVAEEDLEAERHFVVFKLLYRTEGGGEELLLEVPLAADEALFELPALSIAPAEGLPPLSKLVSMDPGKMLDLFRSLKKFQATLRSGGKSHASKAFDFVGNTYDVARDGRIQSAREIGARVGGLFGGLGGAGEAKKPSFLSLDAEVSFEGPGARERTHRRALFSRQDLSEGSPRIPLLTWEVLIQPQPFTMGLAVRGGLEATLDAWRPVLEILEKDPGAGPALDHLASRAGAPYPALLVNLALLREKNLSDALAADGRLRILWDHPNVMVFERRLSWRPGDCCCASELLVDLIENAIGFVPIEPAAEDAAAGASLAQGVFDTVAEAMALEASLPGGIVRSPISAFERARLTGARWLASEADGGVDALCLTREDVEWIRAHEAGRIIIGPAGPAAGGAARGAWWSLDPETGSLVGRIRGGAGGALAEYWQATAAARWVLGVGWCVVDMAYDQAHGDPGRAGTRLVLKFARCATFASVNLIYLGAPGAAVRIGLGLAVNKAINSLFGGRSIAGDLGGLLF